MGRNLDGSSLYKSHDIGVSVLRFAPGWRHPHWGYWLTITSNGEEVDSVTRAAQYFRRLPGVLWDQDAPLGAAWWFPSLTIRFASWRIWDLFQRLGNTNDEWETLALLVRIRALRERVEPGRVWSAEQGPPPGLDDFIARYLRQHMTKARPTVDQDSW